MNPMDTTQTQLKRVMYKKNVSQAELSRTTGISYPQLNTYANGTNNPGKRIQKVIAEALEVAVEDIFTEQDTTQTQLKRAIYEKNMTQVELAKITGINYSQLNTYVNGLKTPRKRIQEIIADKLGVSVEEIFPK